MRKYLMSFLWTAALALTFATLLFLSSLLLPFLPEDIRTVLAGVLSIVLLIFGIGAFGERTFRMKGFQP